MKTIIFTFLLLLSTIGFSQSTEFESNGFTLDWSGQKHQHYGDGFNIDTLSYYWVWEDTLTEKFAMFMEGSDGIFQLKLFQPITLVSQDITNYTLTIKAWYDSTLVYNKSFININLFNITDLNYENVNKITITLSAMNPDTLTKLNLNDNFSILYAMPDIFFQL
jgi:hypothetical protein